jgi:hypothetical protein
MLIVHAWKITAVEEIYIFLGLFMLMVVIQSLNCDHISVPKE